MNVANVVILLGCRSSGEKFDLLERGDAYSLIQSQDHVKGYETYYCYLTFIIKNLVLWILYLMLVKFTLKFTQSLIQLLCFGVNRQNM